MQRRQLAATLAACALVLGCTLDAAAQGFRDTRELAANSARFEVRLPADAELWIQGYKTQTTGDVRRFATPPLEKGKEYTYDLKATSKGKTVNKSVVVKLDYANVYDLTADFKDGGKMPTPGAGGSYTFLIPDAITLKPGEDAEVAIEIVRNKFDQAVELHFHGEPNGITVSDATIPPNRNSVKVVVSATKDAKPQTAKIKIHGVAGSTKAEGTLTIDVAKAGPAGAYTLLPVKAITVKQGEETTAGVSIKRDQHEEPVEILFLDLPKGVRVYQGVIPGNKDTIEVIVEIDKTAAKGAVNIPVIAVCGKERKEGVLKLTIE